MILPLTLTWLTKHASATRAYMAFTRLLLGYASTPSFTSQSPALSLQTLEFRTELFAFWLSGREVWFGVSMSAGRLRLVERHLRQVLLVTLFTEFGTQENRRVIPIALEMLTTIANCILSCTFQILKMDHSPASFLFSFVFSTSKHDNFINKSMWKWSIQYQVLGFEPMTSTYDH